MPPCQICGKAGWVQNVRGCFCIEHQELAWAKESPQPNKNKKKTYVNGHAQHRHSPRQHVCATAGGEYR
jgi:hypothetical protein